MRTRQASPQFDATLSLLRDPYHFVEKQCRRLHADVFSSRLMLRPAVFMHGPAATALFYDPDHFVRAGAAPHRLKKSLFGRGTVQNLDDAMHRQRKALFVSLLDHAAAGRLAERFMSQWLQAIPRWQKQGTVILYDAIEEVLMRAVCDWAGVPLAEHEVHKRTRQVVGLFDGAGAVGPRHWWSRLGRKLSQRWLADLMNQVRAGRLPAPAGAALHAVAHHRDANGELLAPRIAAAELLNLIRPTVAIAVYITFIAHALQMHPPALARLRAGGSAATDYAACFVNEVRRWYPFFPSVIARVKHDFDWGGHHFHRGSRAILDLYGTNHDPRVWTDPEAFRPERFAQSPADFACLIPQGGGPLREGHRCPGEFITIAIMSAACNFLARHLRYTLPPQDLRLDERRLPALPKSRIVLRELALTH